MNIGARLETIAKLVAAGSTVADIGTDHAYLPVYLVTNNIIPKAIAGDIADGPCQAARNTVSMYGCSQQIEVRRGSGLEILEEGEAQTIVIAGMGSSTMIEILEARPKIAQAAKLILQPMTGAEILREWLPLKGWKITEETLVAENNHLYDIICAEYVGKELPVADRVHRLIGDINISERNPLLAQQFEKHRTAIKKLLGNMSHSAKARESDKFKDLTSLLDELEELAHACNLK